MSQFKPFRLFLAAGAAFAALAAAPAQAQGDLLVAPTRVMINQGGSAEVVLSNIGNQPATYTGDGAWRITVPLERLKGETLGALSVTKEGAGSKRHPTIGNRVTIGAGAKVISGGVKK